MAAASSAPRDSDEWPLYFEDNFRFLDRSVWSFDTIDKYNSGWGNGEVQQYTERNAKICDGNLHIVLRRNENKWTSSRITTKSTRTFTFGRVDVCLRTDRTNGVWPAVWALSSRCGESEEWPHCGEIDIFEMQTAWPYIPSTLHFAERNGMKNNQVSFKDYNVDTSQWRVYSMEWTPNYVAFFHDGKELDRYPKPTDANHSTWPFHEGNDFYLIINNAMYPGGQNEEPWGTAPDPGLTSHILEVKYIKVWKYPY